MAELKYLFTDEVEKGTSIVYLDDCQSISVGRAEEVIRKTSLEESVCTGLLAEFQFLSADQWGQAADLFFKKYIYLNRERPSSGFVYAWPADLMRRTFAAPRRPGSFRTIQV
jgi:hypothetical protein